jgi:hypothetical protein
VVAVALAALPAFADEVHLKGGGRVTGEIIEQTEEQVTVDIGGGTLTVRASSVVSIERGISPMQEFRRRAAEVPAGSAEAWRELARWARGNALQSQAEEAYSQVLAILPDDEEANRALGRVQLDGRWVSEEEGYRARGYVEFEGEWMTPAEQRAILADRQTGEEAARRANEERVREIEAEQAAERASAEAESAAFMHGDLPKYGDPVYWGWGAGPTTWPASPQQPPVELGGSVGRNW